MPRCLDTPAFPTAHLKLGSVHPMIFGVGRGLVSFWVGRRPMAEVMADFLGVISAQALVVLSVYFLDSVQPETKHILAIN